FSSRRRHTRWPRDWSSDVCSSDLGGVQNTIDSRFKWARLYGDKDHNPEEPWGRRWDQRLTSQFFLTMRHCHNAWWFPGSYACGRSDERRGGKESVWKMIR